MVLPSKLFDFLIGSQEEDASYGCTYWAILATYRSYLFNVCLSETSDFGSRQFFCLSLFSGNELTETVDGRTQPQVSKRWNIET